MKNLIVVLIILFASILASLPIAKPGLYTIHDDQQVARLFVFDQALKAGQFPVRWVDGLGFGFGYPLFVFYPPFVYMLGEIFHLLGFGFIDSVKIVFFLGIFGSGLAMYIFARELFGKLPGAVSALFYMFVPYRALDIYIRGALAESFSFVWLPLILWSFWKLTSTGKKKYLLLSSAFLALLMITHNLIFLPFMLILPFYLLFLILNSQDKRLITYHLSLITLFTAGLSAFFWIPAIFERRFTIVDDLLLVNLASYKIHFVYPKQLWNWPWGFGGSAAGLADGISFKIGKLHILSSVGVFILGIIFCIRNFRFKLSTVNCSPVVVLAKSGQLSTVFFVLFLFSAFMTTLYSKPIWDLLPPLAYLQFPWRFLIFAALFTSILAGALVYLLRLPILKLITSVILVILLFAPNFKLFKPQAYRPDLTDQTATSKEVINWDVSSSSFDYLPKGVDLYMGPLGTNLVNIKKEDVPKQKVEILSGDARVTTISQEPSRIDFSVVANKPSQVKANVFNFPGWQVKIDGQKTQVLDNDRLKLITFSVPSGKHQVEVEFKNTPIRSLANTISLVSLLILLFFIPSEKTLAFMPGMKRILSKEERTMAFRLWESIFKKWPIKNTN